MNVIVKLLHPLILFIIGVPQFPSILTTTFAQNLTIDFAHSDKFPIRITQTYKLAISYANLSASESSQSKLSNLYFSFRVDDSDVATLWINSQPDSAMSTNRYFQLAERAQLDRRRRLIVMRLRFKRAINNRTLHIKEVSQKMYNIEKWVGSVTPRVLYEPVLRLWVEPSQPRHATTALVRCRLEDEGSPPRRRSESGGWSWVAGSASRFKNGDDSKTTLSPDERQFDTYILLDREDDGRIWTCSNGEAHVSRRISVFYNPDKCWLEKWDHVKRVTTQISSLFSTVEWDNNTHSEIIRMSSGSRLTLRHDGHPQKSGWNASIVAGLNATAANQTVRIARRADRSFVTVQDGAMLDLQFRVRFSGWARMESGLKHSDRFSCTRSVIISVVKTPAPPSAGPRLGSILGGVAGGLLLIIVCVVVGAMVRRRRRRRDSNSSSRKRDKSETRGTGHSAAATSQSGQSDSKLQNRPETDGLLSGGGGGPSSSSQLTGGDSSNFKNGGTALVRVGKNGEQLPMRVTNC